MSSLLKIFDKFPVPQYNISRSKMQNILSSFGRIWYNVRISNEQGYLWQGRISIMLA